MPTSSRSRGLALGAAAVVAVGLVAAFGSDTGATEPLSLEVVSVDDRGTAQDVPDTVVPAISDTGAVVVYETVEPANPRVWIRDRAGDTSRPVAEVNSVAPAVSGNGCTVAYVVLAANRIDANLSVVDRCATPSDFPLPVAAVLDTVTLDPITLAPSQTPEVAAPAVSFDGSAIVWSTGREIRRYVRPTIDAPYTRSHSFDLTAVASPGAVTGDGVDISADGSTVVYTAGPGQAAFGPAPANVYLWTLTSPDPQLLSVTATGDPATFDSSAPTLSADGAFVVFETTATDLAAVGAAPVVTPFVVGVDRVAGTAQVLVDDATRPSLSADGAHVAYQRAGAIRLLSSIDGAVTDAAPPELAASDPTGPVAISQHGRWLVFGSAVDLLADPPSPTPGVPAVWAADRTASDPDVVDTTTTTAPPTTPTTSPPTTPTTPTTSEVASSPTAPATTLAPTPVVPTVPRFPSSSFVPATIPRPTSSSSFSSSSFSSSSFTPAALAASASPVSFEPTVAGVGRRTQPVTLFNTTAGTLGVTSATVAPAGTFAIVSDGCSGLRLAAGASCSIEVQFAPVEVGFVTGFATFVLDTGSIISAALDGEGVPEPTLDLVPEVAGAGQTVTVFGVGFPAGATVELTQPGVGLPEPVVVDPDGTFAHVIVVLPNTPIGPMLLSVAGQPDAFNDVGAELLVSTRGANSDGVALLSSPTRR